MNKALKVLKSRLKGLQSARKIVDMQNTQLNLDKPIELVNEAIEELELLQNRSCENCKNIYTPFHRLDTPPKILNCKVMDNHISFCNILDLNVGSDFYCKKWESK
ncbi:hypothetical protein PT520_09460 [Aliarcobacter butzleri]|uniref:Uncharacterized protein n=1 Tax=Aliarcobacter butzleri TaxID=28197 RepID=A0AAW6VQ91_9BACT|nr:hypothetical protein [Aliarcobacter butzleri]MDK2062742.1 hypothetical protein [Aliarcobacter butzleri]